MLSSTSAEVLLKPEKLRDRGRAVPDLGKKFARGIGPEAVDSAPALAPLLVDAADDGRSGNENVLATGEPIRDEDPTAGGGTIGWELIMGTVAALGGGDIGGDIGIGRRPPGAVAGGGSGLKCIGTGPVDALKSISKRP